MNKIKSDFLKPKNQKPKNEIHSEANKSVYILREIKSNHQQQQSSERSEKKNKKYRLKLTNVGKKRKTNKKFRPKTNKAATKLH